ncbi:Scr1 family TA system antitoxin-like transcriptional regulator [Actinomadura chokoriensis]|uniref:Scr1 family TA system antitoxin-like transcriptional regulator n=1 Tax=Actinomadura chokoriensis TaxID=454156 RepID=A0ABV4R635_9ACTN
MGWLDPDTCGVKLAEFEHMTQQMTQAAPKLAELADTLWQALNAAKVSTAPAMEIKRIAAWADQAASDLRRRNQLAHDLDRQKLAFVVSARIVWVLMDEDAVTSEIGGRRVMCAQLAHLLELGGLPHVSVRLILKSAGAHLGLDGPFRLITVKNRQIAYAGARRGGRLIEDAAEVQELAVDYERIGFKALSEDASRARIAELLEVSSEDRLAQELTERGDQR